MNKNKLKKIVRKHIPEKTRLRLWVRAGGRCQFKHCNKTLYEHSMTLSPGNFADVAHIIGYKENAARGGTESLALQIEYSNLMLMCKECHKLIDDNPENYPVILLRQWKKEHENHIEIMTSLSPDVPRSTILKMEVNIGDRIIRIPQESIYNAMFSQEPPKYPTGKTGITIEETEFDRSSPPEYWQYFAEKKIRNKVIHYLKEGIDGEALNHLSIFAVGPMPFLMYLGRCVGDTIRADIYQAQRNICDTNKSWCWKKEKNILNDGIKLELLEKAGGNKVAIILSISDFIEPDKYKSYLNEGYTIYKISTESPSLHLVSHPLQVEEFSRLFRDTLNRIQKEHGKDSRIFLLPAIPVSFAIEIGRVLLPTKDPDIIICEMTEEKEFRPVLKLL